MPHKVTLQDVANAAGVSKATASLVLSGHPRISEPTRQRVLAAVSDLGYVYNQRAASLRTQRSYTVGLIVTDISNPFYADLTAGIEDHLKENGYCLLLGTSHDNLSDQDRLIRTMRERDADGLILVPAVETEGLVIAELQHFLPLVLVSRYLPDIRVDYVGVDNEIGARRAVEYLILNGHKRIAFIGGNEHSSARRDRVEGYRAMLQKHEISYDSELDVAGPVSRQGGYQVIQALMAASNRPTAALCYNDVVAFGVMLGLRTMGIEPGQDFAVIGFDDVNESSLWSPPLATVGSQPSLMGQEAARLLLNRIQNFDTPIQHVIMPSTLIQRSSANFKP